MLLKTVGQDWDSDNINKLQNLLISDYALNFWKQQNLIIDIVFLNYSWVLKPILDTGTADSEIETLTFLNVL